MKEQILQLCKRLNKFSLADIELISEVSVNELLPILKELISENKLMKKQNIYYYIKRNCNNSSKLPLMFQYHSNQDIDYIIRAFCADIEVMKTMQIFNSSQTCINKFYRFLRDSIYKSQYEQLLKHFDNEPKIGQERNYMGTNVYLYLYNDKLYVSEKLLKSKKMNKHTNDERLKIKNIYLRSFRKVLNRSFSYKFHLHLSEELWKWGKDYKQRYSEINKLIFT